MDSKWSLPCRKEPSHYSLTPPSKGPLIVTITSAFLPICFSVLLRMRRPPIRGFLRRDPNSPLHTQPLTQCESAETKESHFGAADRPLERLKMNSPQYRNIDKHRVGCPQQYSLVANTRILATAPTNVKTAPLQKEMEATYELVSAVPLSTVDILLMRSELQCTQQCRQENVLLCNLNHTEMWLH